MDSNTGDRDDRPRSGISPQTLIIASVASVAASFAVARIWGPGTLLGAAAAPVIVALVSETLRRPMRTATATARKMPTRGHATAPDAPLTDAPATAWRRPRWGLALATGLAAFAIVVGVFTVPDLVAGSSITGNGQPTTFFGGPAAKKKSKPPTTKPAQTTVTKPAPTTITKTVPATTSTTARTRIRTTSTSSTTTAAPTTPTAAAVTTATTPPAAAP